MIEKLDYDWVGRSVQVTLIDKINEVIDHLNEVHEKGGHINYAPPTDLGWGNSFCSKKEEESEDKT